MSLSIETIRLLVAKGLTAEDILQIAETLAPAFGRSAAAERQARYRARGGGKIPEEMRQAVFDRDGWVCLDCGAEDNLCCDHVVPVAKGGETDFENLQTLCIPCNSRKRDRIRKRDVRRVRGQSEDIPGTVADGVPPLDPPSLLPQTPKTLPPIIPPPTKKPRVVAHRLPEDWEPSELTGETGKAVAKWPPGALERELERFRDWAASASGANARKVDWQAAWRNWVRKADDEGRYRNDRRLPYDRRDGVEVACDRVMFGDGELDLPPVPFGRQPAGDGRQLRLVGPARTTEG